MRITHKLLASVSSAAYTGVTQLRKLGFDEVIRYRKNNIAAYLCIHKASRQVVVAFRGSDDWKDWKANLKFLKVKTPFNREVHSGFQASYDTIREGLESYLDQLVGWDLYCTGHSLGAAMATLCCVQSGTKFKEVVTFGCPRVYGSNNPINLSKYNVVRYVNKSDIVCRIPVVGYEHSGDLFYINTENEIRENPSPTYMKANSIWKFWNWFKDHKVDQYVKALA